MMSDLKFQNDLDREMFFSVRRNKLFLFLFLFGLMAIFYLCNLHIVYINKSCDTYSLLQIPIIVGACAGGPLIGVILGGLGATMELAYASFSSSRVDVLNSPFAFFEAGGGHFSGNISSIFICFLSRLALALVVGWIFKAFKNRGKSIWQLILVAVSAFFGILFSHIVVFLLFNLVFVNFLPPISYAKEFVDFINSLNWLSFSSELIANLAIDPLVVYAVRMIVKLD